MENRLTNYNIEKHPWNWFVPEGSKTLIIGTFPSAMKNWKYEFYYPNPANLFWRIMSEISGIELKHFAGEEAVTERKKILTELKLAVTDMGKVIRRHNNSSLDEQLEIQEYMEILQILEEHPSIEKIIFTSSTGKSSATGWFRQYLKNAGMEFKFPKGVRPIRTEYDLAGRNIKIVVAYSPSPRAANRITFQKLVEIYQSEILK